MQKFRAVLSVDTSLSTRLDGVYSIEKYVLIPCQITEKKFLSLISNFIIQFDFDGLEEKNSDKKGLVSWHNQKKAIDEAKVFIAWLVCASRYWARLSSIATGPSMSFGSTVISPADAFDESVLDRVFHINKKPRKGTFVKIPRPNFAPIVKGGTKFKLPLDFPDLTAKLFSLESKEREKFLNACFSYQFALEMYMQYPTISILALVSAVESMMVDEFTSQFCKDAKKRCLLKSDVMKKFRTFFERSLTYPLPKELKKFLNDVYSKRRSTYVHRALLGVGRSRGPYFGMPLFADERKLDVEKRALELLVNAALIEWLRKI